MKKTALVILAIALVGIVTAAGCISSAASSDSPVGDWIIDGTDVTISFNPDGSFAGQSYVNLYFGQYTIDGNKITLTQSGSTMMAGPEMEKENEFFASLGKVTSYEIKDGKLVLSGEGVELVFTEAPKNVVGSWETADGITIEFSEDGSFAGIGPVNNYFGNYVQDGDKLTLELVGATLMAGPDMDKETAYFASLGTVAGFTITDAGLTLEDKDGKAVATFAVAE